MTDSPLEFLGPNAPIAHGSVFTLAEHIATYVTNLISRCQRQNVKSVVPTNDAVEDYFQHVNAFMPQTAWAGNCSSWYKSKYRVDTMDDKAEVEFVTGLHPGSRDHFVEMLREFRGEDWEWEYLGGGDAGEAGKRRRVNRFGYLGNGLTGREVDVMKAMQLPA